MEQVEYSLEPRVLALPLKYDLGQVPPPCKSQCPHLQDEGVRPDVPRCLFWVRWAVICFLLILKTPLSIRGMGDTTLTHPLGICQQLPPHPPGASAF